MRFMYKKRQGTDFISGAIMRDYFYRTIYAVIAVMLLQVNPWGFRALAQGDQGADAIDSGKELVNMDFPELTDIKDIIRAVSLWTGKNVILDRNVNGKVQIISPKKVTKEEAYQAFLSALNVLNLTTVETGKIIKILPVRTAQKANLKTYSGSGWTPRTDEVITQIIPLKYVDARKIKSTLSRIVNSNSLIAYEPTNTLIISDSGFKVRRVMRILELLDVQTQQPQVAIVPIKHSSAKSIADKIRDIFRGGGGKKSGGSYHTYKVLTDERSNSVIIFGPPRTISDVKALVRKFDTPVGSAADQASIHVRPLDYADAKKLASTLSNLASGGKRNNNRNIRRPPIRSKAGSKTSSTPSVADLGDGVKITADEASNSLLITGSRSAYRALNTIIRKLDVRRSQVFVEADILDVNIGNNFSFKSSIFMGSGNEDGTGTKTIQAWEAQNMAPLIVASGEAGTSSSTVTAKDVAGAFAQEMSIGILSGQSVNVEGIGNFTPGALIQMLKADANTRILSSPKVLTTNNEEATFTVGKKVYFYTSKPNLQTGASVPEAKPEEISLNLTLKPNISHSGYITMKVDLEADSESGKDPTGNLPIIGKRKTSQIVTIRTGQTVVISGLVDTKEEEQFRKIPLLGDIPLLGWLFRNSSMQKRKSNLMIFITPHIIHGAEDMAAIYKDKLKERDSFLKEVYGSDYADDEFYKMLPTLEEGVFEPNEFDTVEKQRLQQRKADTLKELGYAPNGGEAIGEFSTGAQESTTPMPIIPGDTSSGGSDFVPEDLPPPSAPTQEPEPIDEEENPEES